MGPHKNKKPYTISKGRKFEKGESLSSRVLGLARRRRADPPRPRPPLPSPPTPSYLPPMLYINLEHRTRTPSVPRLQGVSILALLALILWYRNEWTKRERAGVVPSTFTARKTCENDQISSESRTLRV